MSTAITAPEIDGLKAQLKKTWIAGDYDRFSRYMEQGSNFLRTILTRPRDATAGFSLPARVQSRDGRRGMG